jgi:hypothetical protein
MMHLRKTIECCCISSCSCGCCRSGCCGCTIEITRAPCFDETERPKALFDATSSLKVVITLEVKIEVIKQRDMVDILFK